MENFKQKRVFIISLLGSSITHGSALYTTRREFNISCVGGSICHMWYLTHDLRQENVDIPCIEDKNIIGRGVNIP